MTLLQKALGKNYKWWYVLMYSIKLANTGLFANILQSFGFTFETLAILYIWFEKGASSEIITYLLIGRLYKAISENYLYNAFGDEIISGYFTSRLLVPQPLVFWLIVQMIGKRLIRNLVEFGGYVLAFLVFNFFYEKIDIIFSWRFLLLVFFVPITFVLNHLFGMLIGFTVFFLKDKREYIGLVSSYAVFRNLLAGLIIPISQMPASGFFSRLPYSYILHHPVQIYLGNYNIAQTLVVFCGGIFWCFLLYFLVKIAFKLGLKRNESVGL